MDVQVLAANDRTRAPKAPLMGPALRRLISSTFWHWRLLTAGAVCSLFFAGLSAFGLAGVLPVLKLMLEEEGLGGWAYRTVAGERLGVEWVRRLPDEGFDPEKGSLFLIQRVTNARRAEAAGLRALDYVEPQGAGLEDWLASLCSLPEGAMVSIRSFRLGGNDRDSMDSDMAAYREPREIALGTLSLKGRALIPLVSWISPPGAGQDRLTVLAKLMVVLCFIAAAAGIFRFLGEYWVSKAVLTAMLRLRDRLYRKVMRLPMGFFAEGPSSDLVTRFVQDVQEIQRGLFGIFEKLVREPLKAAFILVVALVIDAPMTLTLLAVAPAAVLVFWCAGRMARKASAQLLRSYGVMVGALTATLQAMDVVKAHNAEEYERKRLAGIDEQMFHTQLRIAALQAAVPPIMELLAVAGLAGVTYWLADRVLTQGMPVSDFLALAAVLAMLTDPLRKVADVYTRIQRASAGAQRIFSILDLPDEDARAGAEAGLLRQALEFEGVTFTYPGAGGPALRDIRLMLHRGETLALVGPNGAGKSTLVNLALGFYAPDQGRMLYDGVDYREFSLESLRRQFALVTQRGVIFDGTLRDNIAYALPDVPENAVRAAAAKAFAEEFILSRPLGYGERAGEGGMLLSGGQRQRVVIARAILRNAPILIFDEATSQVDTDSDEKIHRALKEVTRGRTTLLIAHRPSTFRFADRIVVLDGGRIVDVGKHEELLERCLLYKTLAGR